MELFRPVLDSGRRNSQLMSASGRKQPYPLGRQQMLVQRRVGEAVPDYGVESAGSGEKSVSAGTFFFGIGVESAGDGAFFHHPAI